MRHKGVIVKQSSKRTYGAKRNQYSFYLAYDKLRQSQQWHDIAQINLMHEKKHGW